MEAAQQQQRQQQHRCHQPMKEVEKEEEVDRGDGSRGGADAAQRAARKLAPLFAQAFFPPFRPSFSPLPRPWKSEKEPPRAHATVRADSFFLLLSSSTALPFGISRLREIAIGKTEITYTARLKGEFNICEFNIFQGSPHRDYIHLPRMQQISVNKRIIE